MNLDFNSFAKRYDANVLKESNGVVFHSSWIISGALIEKKPHESIIWHLAMPSVFPFTHVNLSFSKIAYYYNPVDPGEVSDLFEAIIFKESQASDEEKWIFMTENTPYKELEFAVRLYRSIYIRKFEAAYFDNLFDQCDSQVNFDWWTDANLIFGIAKHNLFKARELLVDRDRRNAGVLLVGN